MVGPGPLGHAGVGRAAGCPSTLTLNEPGQDADGAEVDGAPAPEREPEEDRSLAMTLLLVAQAEPGADEQIVAGTVGARVAGRPTEDGAGDQLRVPGRQFVVAQASFPRRRGTERVDEDVGAVEEAMQTGLALFRLEIEHHAPFGAIPGEKAQ